MRTIEMRDERQQMLRDRLMYDNERPDSGNGEKLYTIAECALRLNCSVSTAWKMFRYEEGVLRIPITGLRKPMIRVPESVFERILRRSANPRPKESHPDRGHA